MRTTFIFFQSPFPYCNCNYPTAKTLPYSVLINSFGSSLRFCRKNCTCITLWTYCLRSTLTYYHSIKNEFDVNRFKVTTLCHKNDLNASSFLQTWNIVTSTRTIQHNNVNIVISIFFYTSWNYSKNVFTLFSQFLVVTRYFMTHIHFSFGN